MNLFICVAYPDRKLTVQNYVVGVFSTEEKAKEAAKDEETFRAGYYVCKIYPVVLDQFSKTYK